MSNIEEDIEILEEFIKLDRNIRDNKKESDYEKFCEIRCIAIENVLAERKQDKERIKELEVLEDDLKDKRIVYVDTPEFEEKFIPKQKVKEILIEIQEEYNKLDKEIDKQIKDKNKDYYKCKENIAIMQTLAYCRDKFEGLLEEK